ncbi:hypothetical protein [Shimia sp. R9_3]|uniref:hypothetical protein n=1 Tax=Shimia sp. R9_3 TaxID=2821113 RepID=UPI001ADCE820|nr:hypothetical protein [Shimia sp. R9_3]MBO9401434.1 hypothetical protein [Shimia sp. R9_3]
MTEHMRHTLMLNLDAAHAAQLYDLTKHFRLKAEDTVRLAIRLAHARIGKPDVLVPKFKPSAKREENFDNE